MKCKHGVDLGPLDETESQYCKKCRPRIVPDGNGGFTNAVEFQYLTEEEKKIVTQKTN